MKTPGIEENQNDAFEKTDYVVSCDLLKNYSGMRILALGGGITLLVSLISMERSSDVIENSIQNIILLLSTYVSIRVIGSIHANVYARCIHLEWIESKLGVVGFFTYWNKYVLEKSQNASSNAFILSCIGFNYIGLITILINSYRVFVENDLALDKPDLFSIKLASLEDYSKGLLISAIVLVSVASFIINLLYIRGKKTRTLIPKLKESLKQERDSVIPSKFKF